MIHRSLCWKEVIKWPTTIHSFYTTAGRISSQKWIIQQCKRIKLPKISQSEWRLPFWVEFHQKIVNEESVLWLKLTNKTKTTGHSCILYDSHSQMKASYSYVPYYCTKLVSTRKYSLMKHSTTVRACHWEMQAISLHAFIQIYSTPLGECNEPATL